MIWLVVALIALLAFSVRSYLNVEEENVRLRGENIVSEKRLRDARSANDVLITRNRDLARENNRLAQQIRQQPKIPQALSEAIYDANSKNSPRLDVESIGRVICIPIARWEIIMSKTGEATTTFTSKRVDL